ncbi:hypothetical protein [Luteolibacter marinus]|uniref:hypothetical protein n=1 Tax=Luteolibacter marinus TaxID=2776705 RepID=UPI0018664E1A|nr:hypothetical protein [Luteolibacter marinus]
MDADAIALSVAEHDEPPASLNPALRALWLARKGRWDAAHDLCQDVPGNAGAWIHAWLHREEGDYSNACYWYARAHKPAPAADAPLEAEWFEITRALAG